MLHFALKIYDFKLDYIRFLAPAGGENKHERCTNLLIKRAQAKIYKNTYFVY